MLRSYVGVKDNHNTSARYYNRMHLQSYKDSSQGLVASEIEKFRVKIPTKVAPSVIIFSLSLTLVVTLVAAEVLTRQYDFQSCFFES